MKQRGVGFILKNICKSCLKGKAYDPDETFELKKKDDEKTFPNHTSKLEVDIPVENHSFILCGSGGSFDVKRKKSCWSVTFYYYSGDPGTTGPANVEAGVKD